ncbi:ATP-binding protein [Vulcanisaeta thermophila]|uniref:ATP-binding protein n=1 Tax=Vulcanisaeta thermophila TaxID=867917 RepID=UPI000B12F098|nr:ATP-binding protein [Vulcanisaeta thermophila]
MYVNFEDIRLMGIKPNHFSTFLKVINELAREFKGRIAIMMDKTQNIPQWGRWVRSLLDRRRYHVVITGSSSKLGIAEIPTELRGRYIQRLLLPFSFREYLRARGFEARHLGAPEQLGKLLGLLRDYVTHGGFPEIVLRPDLARDLVRVYRDTVFYRDVVERHGIRDTHSFEVFMRIVEDSFGKYLSISSIHNYFRSLGIRKSKKTLANYLRYLEEALYIVTVRRYGTSTKAQLQQPRKVYPIDPAYFRRESLGPMMESIVAVELLRRGIEHFYYRANNYEVDFVITQRGTPQQLLQVTTHHQ